MKKLLIANRGEIACRVIRSCKSLGIQSVAVYSEADSNSLHVELADEAYLIGPAKAADSYLKADKILEVALQCGADAVHPGYGFLAESASFSSLLNDHGLIWVGPSEKSIEDMGDKERARAIAVDAGVPVLPGSRRFAVGDLEGLERQAEQVGFPLLVKASAGGGGIGMQLVESQDKVRAVAESTQSMAERSFGDGTIFMERYIPRARHVEIQVFGFGDGRAVHFYERECSIQRRFQKIIEEAPAPGLPADVRDKMAQAAVDLTASQRYSGAGTVEFIVDADTFEFFFLEMNTRIQVEHPVTEMTTNSDLVAMQIKLAFGEDLSAVTQDTIVQAGHAIESRIYAEDPNKMFLPSPGTLTAFDVAAIYDDPAVRLDTGVREGDQITAYYDPMIAKLICYGATRDEASNKSVAALSSITVDGVANNVGFLINTLRHKDFVEQKLFTGFVDKNKAELLAADKVEVTA